MKTGIMERIKIFSMALFMLVLVLLPTKMECQMRPRPMPLPLPMPLPPPVAPRPLCASQFSLVNYACALLPYSLAPPLPPPSPTPTPPSPPSPDDDNSDGQSHGHGHRHGHGHGHGHGHRHKSTHFSGHKETHEEEDCCRWLKEVDNECVCDLLVHLPIFLARPVHEYTVIVDDSCNVTYTCSGRLIRT